MKHIVLLFVVIAVCFFAWRYVMKARERGITRKWGGRAAVSFFVAVATVLSLFAVLTLTSWRFF